MELVVTPIGNAGALLQSSKKERLATLISTQPAKQLETQRAERLARSLTTVAARRLHGITQRYYQRRREAAADQRGEKTPHQRSCLAGQKRARDTQPVAEPATRKGSKPPAADRIATKRRYTRRLPWTGRRGRHRTSRPSTQPPKVQRSLSNSRPPPGLPQYLGLPKYTKHISVSSQNLPQEVGLARVS